MKKNWVQVIVSSMVIVGLLSGCGDKTSETTPLYDFSETQDSNLVFLLDVSGSMYDEDKLPLLQKAFSMLTKNLTEKDTVSIVTYAGGDKVVLEGVSGDNQEEILRAISYLEASGSTAGSAGIKRAYEIASEYYIEGGNNRVILATDGDLNVGLTTEKELEELITYEKESGVYLSVLGFGSGNLKDNKMETLADKGNGNYSYIDFEREAHKVLVEEMGATLMTIAKDVKFQVEFDPEMIEGYRLIGYENRALENKDFEDDTKDAGEIGAGHSVTVLYELIPTVEGEKQLENRKATDNCALLNIRYKEPEGEESQLLQYGVSMEIYKKNPSDDWLFAAAVAEFGQVLRNSEYKGDANLKDVKNLLEKIQDRNYYRDDEYKQEFFEIVDSEIR